MPSNISISNNQLMKGRHELKLKLKSESVNFPFLHTGPEEFSIRTILKLGARSILMWDKKALLF